MSNPETQGGWWADFKYRDLRDEGAEQFGASLENIEKIVAESRRRALGEVKEMVKESKRIGAGGHGNCCTCQTCKFHHDDCECAGNRKCDDILTRLSALMEE